MEEPQNVQVHGIRGAEKDAGDRVTHGTGWLVGMAAVGVLLTMPAATAIGIYQELPQRVSLDQEYRDITIQVSDSDRTFKDVEDIILFLASPSGATGRALWSEPYLFCSSYENGYYEEYKADFKLTEADAEYGKDYQFKIQVTFCNDDYKSYPKTSEYAVKINPRLNAAFTVAKDGLTIQVDASKSAPIGNENLNFLWTWGDGSPEFNTTSPLSEHRYAGEGTFTISLTTSDPFGQTKETSQSIVVEKAGAFAPGPDVMVLLLVVGLMTVVGRKLR